MKLNGGVWAGCMALMMLGGCLGLPSEQEIVDAIAERAEERLEEARDKATGGGGSDETPQQTFAAARDRLATMPNTAFSGMPVVGTAGFEGAARLGVDPAGAAGERQYVGRAVLGVDFGSESMVGRINDLRRRDSGREIDGVLILRNGDIGIDRPNDFEVDVAGTLTDSRNRIGVNDRVRGDFRGTPIKGVAVGDAGTGATWNGRNADFTLEMYLEAQ